MRWSCFEGNEPCLWCWSATYDQRGRCRRCNQANDSPCTGRTLRPGVPYLLSPEVDRVVEHLVLVLMVATMHAAVEQFKTAERIAGADVIARLFDVDLPRTQSARKAALDQHIQASAFAFRDELRRIRADPDPTVVLATIRVEADRLLQRG